MGPEANLGIEGFNGFVTTEDGVNWTLEPDGEVPHLFWLKVNDVDRLFIYRIERNGVVKIGLSPMDKDFSTGKIFVGGVLLRNDGSPSWIETGANFQLKSNREIEIT